MAEMVDVRNGKWEALSVIYNLSVRTPIIVHATNSIDIECIFL